MIANLEWKQSNAQQNIEQLQNPTMGVTINNESATSGPSILRQTDSSRSHLRGVNVLYWYKVFALDSAVIVQSTQC